MRCVEISAFGPPEGLRLAERPTPAPAAGEVLIEVHAAGVNRPDVIQRYGKYRRRRGRPTSRASRWRARRGTGAGVTRWHDRRYGLRAGGRRRLRGTGASRHEGQCLPVPRGCTAIEAAAIPETFFTVWTNVFQRGRLAAGEWMLMHGGTSGIGTTAIQLAAARGARVAATAGSDGEVRGVRATGRRRMR